MSTNDEIELTRGVMDSIAAMSEGRRPMPRSMQIKDSAKHILGWVAVIIVVFLLLGLGQR